MLDIAAQAHLDKAMVIDYTIDGVQDEEVYKAVLYGAKTIRELKEKFGLYEKMRANTKIKESVPEGFSINTTDEPEIDLSHIESPSHRKVVKEIIETYKSDKVKDTGIKLSIVLKDDVPIYRRPRGSSLKEKEEVDEHNSVLQSLKKAQNADPSLTRIKDLVGKESYKDFYLENSVLRKQIKCESLIVVPNSMQSIIVLYVAYTNKVTSELRKRKR
ncbi:hypothetical protein KPH14_012196 [Odynerus spinipes]|uniref:Uncharacterized protein n=1 Tax=Odynerus spinipes TaxID=1348599 RepID=A0AAD9RGX0_9HYME|nr:hypothetical protein KPH14_012196 [Odynerus spinipes]